MSITHALIQFFRGDRAILPVSEIPGFSAKHDKDFNINKKVKVWSRPAKGMDASLLNAYILLLGESESDIVHKRKKFRVKGPNKRLMSFNSEAGSSSAKSINNQEVKQKQTASKKTKKAKTTDPLHNVATMEQKKNILYKYSKLVEEREFLDKSFSEEDQQSISKKMCDRDDTFLLPPEEQSFLDSDDEIAARNPKSNFKTRNVIDSDDELQKTDTQDNINEKLARSNTLEVPKRRSEPMRQSTSKQRFEGRQSAPSRLEPHIYRSTKSTPPPLERQIDAAARRARSPMERQNTSRGSTPSPIQLQINRFRESTPPRVQLHPNLVRHIFQTALATSEEPKKNQIWSTFGSSINMLLSRLKKIKKAIYIQKWIYLYENISISKDMYEYMKAHCDSKFVREMATTLWGTETLQKRCLDPIKANKGKENYPEEEKRKVLTPEKYEVLKARFHEKITEAGVEGKLRVKRMKKLSTHMRAKLYDVRRNLNI